MQPLTIRQSLLLERVQKRCFRVILGRTYNGYEDALQRLKTTTLEKRRIKLCYNFARKVLKSDRHRDLLPPPFDHRYNTRARNKILPSVKCRTDRYFKSSVPYMVRLLNGEN